MKALITGGAGFIGSNLAQFLLDKGYEVSVVDSLITGSEKNLQPFHSNNRFKFFKADLCEFDLTKFDRRFDSIFHLASPASPKAYGKYPIETLMVNSVGTKNVLDFMKHSGSKALVLASTSEVYGDPQVHPQPETYFGNVNPLGWRSCYDEGKRFAEAETMAYFRKYNLNVHIARIFNTYGPNMEKDDGRVISNFIIQCLSENPITIYGDGKQSRSFCFVSDMVEGLYLLATKSGISGEVVNLGNPDERTILDIADQIKKLIKSNSDIVFKNTLEDDPKKRKPDITKAKKLLGWNPKVNLQLGLQKTIDYFKTRFF